MNTSLTRRRFLRSAGVLLALPALEVLQPRGFAAGNTDSQLYVSSDGQTWQELVLPETPITSLEGIAFDAAGDLYLLRGSRLFRHTLP